MDLFDFVTYPSKSDLKSIMDEFPTIKKIFIKSEICLKDESIKNLPESILNPMDFSNWKNRLVNKLGKLRFSYVHLVHYSRNLPDECWIKQNVDDGTTTFFPEFENKDYHKKFMFDYFTENFYYHFFSAVDIISYLLNTFYDLNIKEGMSFSKNVQAKIPDSDLKSILDVFLRNTEAARNDRNSLTHRFPFNEIDMRSKRFESVIQGGTYHYRSSFDTTKEIQVILIELERLLRTIERKMKNVA